MIFDYRRAFTGTGSAVNTDSAPGARTSPNLTLPRTAPVSGKLPSALALYAVATASLTVTVTLYGLIESPDDVNAVDNFAAVQDQANAWAFIATATLTNDAVPQVISNLTPGRYFLRVTGGTAVNGGTILGASL